MGRAQVVVGVDDSPAGLRALRVAVTQARLAHRELVAVRAFPLPRDQEARRGSRLADGPSSCAELAGPSQSWLCELAERQRLALREVAQAFGEAMGEVPDTVRMRWLAPSGPPGPVLVALACPENDLLIVGTPASRRPRLFRRSVSRYCAAHAACPVLLVPPPELARDVRGRHGRWQRRELDKLLTD